MPYPLATLGCTVGPTGISAPSYTDILLSLVASAQSIFGSDVLITPDTQDYQLLAIIAMAINDSNQANIATYNSFQPTFAQGSGLSSLVKINGLARIAATNSTAVLAITGTVGTVIANGLVQDTAGNLWALPPLVVIPGGGSISVSATCLTPGAVAAAPSTITQILTVINGWQSVTNASSATLGTDAESDAALRARQAQSTAIAARTPLAAILAAVANVPGVTRYAIYENPTGSADSNGIPAHSISVVALGGSINAIAQGIASTKSPGTGTFGSTPVAIQDAAGQPITINFYVLATTAINVAVTIKALNGYVASTGVALQAAIASYINALPIGGKVYFNGVLAAAQLQGPLGLTYTVTALTLNTGTADIAIAFNAASIIGTNVLTTT